MTESNQTVSIVILVKNEEEYLKNCLDSVFSQATYLRTEVLVIDSGSDDSSLTIARSFKKLKVLQIKPEEFGHGKTRNLGGEKTKGDFIVWLNGDAVPADLNWLENLIKPMLENETIAGVYSRHLPAPDCHLYMARDLDRFMPDQPAVKSRASKWDLTPFSTVSCAIRRSMWQRFPFKPDIDIIEDYDWGHLILNQGYKIMYQPRSKVIHSHNFTPGQMYRLKFRVSRVQKTFSSLPTALLAGFFTCTAGFIARFLGDLFYIFRHKISMADKLKEVRISFLARLFGFWGRFRGGLEK